MSRQRSKLIQRITIVLILGVLGNHLMGETQVLISSSKNLALIGDQINLKVIAKTDSKADKVKILSPRQEFEVISHTSQPRQENNNESVFEENLMIVFFKTGDFEVGPFTVKLLKGDEEVETKETNSIPVKIKSVLTEEDKDIKPLKNPIEIKGNPLYVLKYVLIILAAILIVIFVIVYVKRKKRKTGRAPEPLLPAVEEFALKIKELTDLKLMQKGKMKEHFFRLTEIIKHFLNREYGFNAEDLTTFETMLHLDAYEKDSSIRDRMGFVLNTADLVKFAKYVAGSEIIDEIQQKLEDVIGAYRQRNQQKMTEEPKQNAASGQ